MYSFLDFLSEFLERYSWIIVPSLIGALVIALVWSKVPKPEPALREAKIRQKLKSTSKKFYSRKIALVFKVTLIIIGFLIMVMAKEIGLFLGVYRVIPFSIGCACCNFAIWVL